MNEEKFIEAVTGLEADLEPLRELVEDYLLGQDTGISVERLQTALLMGIMLRVDRLFSKSQ